jgi:hypothetical protein
VPNHEVVNESGRDEPVSMLMSGRRERDRLVRIA